MKSTTLLKTNILSKTSKTYEDMLREIKTSKFDYNYFSNMFKKRPDMNIDDLKNIQINCINIKNDVYYIYSGICYYYNGNVKRMLASFNNAVMVKSPDAYFLIGSYYNSIKNYKLMIRNMAIAADIYNHQASLISLAYFYQYVRKNKAYMLKYYKLAIDLYDNGYAMYKLGNYYEDSNANNDANYRNYKLMLYYYKKAYKTCGNVDAIINIGNHYMTVGNYRKMFKYFKIAKRNADELQNYNVYFSLGYYYQFINFNFNKMFYNYRYNICKTTYNKYLLPAEYNLYNYFIHKNDKDNAKFVLFIKYEKTTIQYMLYNKIYIPFEIYNYIICNMINKK